MLFNFYPTLVLIWFTLDITVENYIGHWVETSNDYELACRGSSIETVECYLSQGDGKTEKYNYTIQGSTITRNDNFRIKGKYTGNGLVSWFDGNSWIKQGSLE